LEYHHSDLKRFIFDDLATLCVNLVNFGPVNPEFKMDKDVHPLVRQSAVWLRSLSGATARPCGDQYWVLWGDHYSVLFQLFTKGHHCYAARATC